MLTKHTDSPSRQQLHFHFPSGAHEGKSYVANVSFCPNPVCTCGHLDLEIEAEQAAPVGPLHQHTVGMDVFAATLDECNGTNAGVADEFGRELVRNMDAEDWGLLKKVFLGYKRSITEQTPDEEIDTHFRAAEIEREGIMTGFQEILPFAEERTIEIDGKTFILDEQYCLRKNCDCTGVYVTFVPTGEGAEKGILAADRLTTIFVDYASGKTRVADEGAEPRSTVKRMGTALRSSDNRSWLQRRHTKLRSLYRFYRQRQAEKTQDRNVVSSKKVGRNDPCPCGSGKKYKKCCLLK